MKKHFTLLLLCLSFQCMKGQQSNFSETINHLFEHLDFSEVTTGLLLQHSIPFAKVDSFEGTELTEFNKMDVDKFGLLYATLYGAALDTSMMLPDPDSYMDVRNALQPGDAIPLAIFNYDYHSLRDDAISLNLLTVVDTQLYDVPNRTESPYLLKRAFGIAPLKRYCDSLEMQFVLPSGLLFSNSIGIDSFEMDADDGYGYRLLSFDDTLNITYEEAGEKTLKFRVILSDSTELISHARFEVRDGGNVNRVYGLSADETIPITATPDRTGGSLQFLYDCSTNGSGSNPAWKPLLYIEGYEPQIGDRVRDIDFLRTQERFGQDDPATGVKILDILDAQGYDLIYLDFNFNADNTARNAEVVKEALRIINDRKAMLGSHEKTVVIGASMGGVVGKYALLSMEAEAEDHDVKTFISLDGTMRGANIPVGFQFMIRHLLGLQVQIPFMSANLSYALSSFVPIVDNALDAVQAPFLKEMLVYNLLDAYAPIGEFPSNVTGASLTTSTYTAFQSELAAMGDLQNCEYIVISNGAIDGTSGQGFTAGAKLLSVDFTAEEFWDWAKDKLPEEWDDWVEDVAQIAGDVLLYNPISDYSFDFDVWSLPDNPSSFQTVYQGDIRLDITLYGLTNIPICISCGEGKVKETIPYDNAPGGSLPIKTDGLPPFVDLIQDHICFVPTVSSLDIPYPENQNLNLNLSNVEAIITSGLTTVDRYDASTDATFGGNVNQKHASLNPTNIPFFMAELTSKDNLSSPTLSSNGNGDYILDDRTYNYGDAAGLFNPASTEIRHTPHQLKHSLRVEDAGKLWVNRNDRIDFTDVTANPQNLEGNHFDLFINGFDNCEAGDVALYIENGGEMKIGKSPVFNTADVYVQDGAKVFVGSGGEVIMEDKSRYIVDAGGETTIKDGGLFQSHDTGKTIIKSGGVFTVESGGILRMVDFSEFLIEPGGQLVLEDGAIVHLWDNNGLEESANIHVQGELVIEETFEFDGSGYFQFDEGHVLTMGSNAEFKLIGKGKGRKFLKLNDDATLTIGGKKLYLKDGDVDYKPGTAITAGEGISVVLKNVAFNQLTEDASSDALLANESVRITVDGCDFNRLRYGIYAEELEGTAVGTGMVFISISNSKFLDCELAVEVSNTPSINLNKNLFEATESYPFFGLALDNVANAYVTNTTFKGYTSSFGAVNISDVPDYNMISGLVTENDLGIFALGHSNIDMRSGATVSENGVGIQMDGGQDYGVLTMDCAKLLDNGVGAKGTDLVLNIDASGELKSNHFSNQLSQRLFEICYDELGGMIGTQIDAKENLWEGTIAFRIQNPDAPGFVSCSYYYNNVTLVNLPDVETINCSLNPPDFPPSPSPTPNIPSDNFTGDDPDCKINRTEVLYDRYWDAYAAYLLESMDTVAERSASDSLYLTVASIPDSIGSTYSLKCQQLIHIARSRVDSPSSLWLSVPNNGKPEKDVKSLKSNSHRNALALKPNPTDGNFIIDIAPNLYQIEVYNAVGSQVLSGFYFGKEHIATQGWPDGLYFVKLLDVESNERYVGKLSVKK